MQLESAYAFHKRVMESATDAIFTLDLQGNFTLVNQRTARDNWLHSCRIDGTAILKTFSL
jgi:PAS domain-containing protein